MLKSFKANGHSKISKVYIFGIQFIKHCFKLPMIWWSLLNCMSCVLKMYSSANVPACRSALRSYVLTCPVSSRANVPCKLTWSLANVSCMFTCVACLHVHLPTCLACLCAHLPKCLACSHANVPGVLMWSRANVSWVLMCSRVNVPCVLTCSRTNVPCVLTCQRARFDATIFSFTAISQKLPTLLVRFKSLITAFPQ